MARKSSGSGKPRKKGNSYEHRIRVLKSDGTWGEKSFSAPSALEARKRGDEYERLIAQGIDPSGGDQKIADFIPQWLARHEVRTKRQRGHELSISTKLNYERTAAQIIEAVGTAKLKGLNSQILEDAIYHNDARPHVALARYKLFNLAFKSAVKDGQIDFNPMERIDVPFVAQSKEGVFFEPHELETIFAAAVGTRWQYSLQIHLQLGARISELLALRESDVDYVNNTVTISKSTMFLRMNYGQIKPTKNYETRVLPVSDECLELFRKQRDFRAAQYGEPYKAAIWHQDEDELIFPNKIGELWNQQIYLNALHEQVYSKTGITRPFRKTLGTHCWRHTAGAILISRGVPLKVVSEFLGHKSQAVTEKIYVHILEQPKQEVASILSTVLI